jgi:beta-glucuronidase
LNAGSLEIKNKGVFPVKYEDFGEFKNIGKSNFEYKINKSKELKNAVGDYIYPNFNVPEDMRDKYKEMLENRAIISGDIWANVDSGNAEADILAWVAIPKVDQNLFQHSQGIKQFFIAEILTRLGEYEMAIKAYYSVIINFPITACWNSDSTFVWYVAPASLDKINLILREHPELRVKIEGAFVEVENGNDVDLTNDIIKVNPGKFVRLDNFATNKVDITQLEVINKKGTGKVRLVQYSNKDWQLLVDNKPFVVHGITYSPTKVGLKANAQNGWMSSDINKNGIIDAPYESWVDANKNNIKDPSEKEIGDFKLMKDMGVNTIRMYHTLSNTEYIPEEFNKKLLRDMYANYGITVTMGDFFGAYGIGTGGEFTDYRNKRQKAMMKENVRKMVLDNKDEPYLLMWLLGNENDMPTTSDGSVNATNTNARQYPQEYASFVSEVIDMIHKLDPNHPVMVGNMTTDLLAYYDNFVPAMDIYGINLYMGKGGFGSTWKTISRKMDIPVLISEYGCDAYFEAKGIDEDSQADYHKGNWKDIEYNLAGGQGAGNSIGGIAFEWLDEWWKSGADPNMHDAFPQSALPFPDGWAHEEWFGIAGQGDGKNSPFLRDLRKVYSVYKNELWNKKN